MSGLNEPTRLFICVAGIFLFYLWYGICQEELYVFHLYSSVPFGLRCPECFLFSSSGLVTHQYRDPSSYKTYYGDTEKKKFTYSVFLLFAQCLVNAFAAFLGALAFLLVLDLLNFCSRVLTPVSPSFALASFNFHGPTRPTLHTV